MQPSYPTVVRIYATTQEPDYDCPWQARTPASSTGSGVIIGPNTILTGAHVVANATFLQAQKISDPEKIVAKVKAVCHDIDLALLEVENNPFGGIVPAEIGDLPHLRDKVSVVGFPVGGEEVSITEGVVSRLEVQRYSHSQRHFLAVTVDAAINRGNSGGPVFKDGKVAGIAFQKLTDADNIGEMVPAPIIRHFLEGVKVGKRLQCPGLGIATQNMENPQLRHSMGMRPADSGVLVLSVEYEGSGWNTLQPRDVLLEIEGMKIANNGTVKFRNRYRTRYDVVLGQHFIGDTLTTTVLRKGEKKQFPLLLKPLRYLVPRSQYDVTPSYFVYGGLVFQILTRDFLSTWDKWWNKAPKEFLHYYYSGVRTEQRQEIVVLTQILADKINLGYAHLYNEGVTGVNGRVPINLKDLVHTIESTQGVVEIKTSSDGLILLDTKQAQAANQRILDRYHITRDRSAEL